MKWKKRGKGRKREEKGGKGRKREEKEIITFPLMTQDDILSLGEGLKPSGTMNDHSFLAVRR
jgi:hypothetical protein